MAVASPHLHAHYSNHSTSICIVQKLAASPLATQSSHTKLKCLETPTMFRPTARKPKTRRALQPVIYSKMNNNNFPNIMGCCIFSGVRRRYILFMYAHRSNEEWDLTSHIKSKFFTRFFFFFFFVSRATNMYWVSVGQRRIAVR